MQRQPDFKMMEPMPVPVLPPKRLEGKASDGRLQGNAEDGGAADLQGLKPSADNNKKVLQGNADMQTLGASAQDPDMDDQEMMVEWDRWRNRFLTAVQNGVQEQLNNSGDLMMRYDPRTRRVISRFPLGTTAWFSCQVTPTRKVVNLKIMESSGFPNFDQAVLDSVMALEGSSILRYPRGSQRKIVAQAAGIKTSDAPGTNNFRFGDVERYRVPGN